MAAVGSTGIKGTGQAQEGHRKECRWVESVTKVGLRHSSIVEKSLCEAWLMLCAKVMHH
jgi:hypothetical protein